MRHYRAFNKKTKQMEPVLLICFVNKYVDVLPLANLEGGSQESWGFEEIELMEATGLRDSKGVEIYESDIVRVWHRRWNDYSNMDEGFYTVGVVEYSPAEFYIRGDGYSITCHFHYNDSDREVLGNVYEHPHLLGN